MTGQDKPKKGPSEKAPKLSRNEEAKQRARIIRKQTKSALGELRAKMSTLTRGAKDADLPSVRHGRFLELAEKRLKEIEAKYLKDIDALFSQASVKSHKQEALAFVNTIKELFKQRAGVKGTIEQSEYAYFYSYLENIIILSKHYGADISLLFTHIQQGNLSKKEWDTICKYIKQYPYKKSVTNGGDAVNLSVTAFLFKALDQNQRFMAVKEFSKRYGGKEAEKLADSLVKANVINLKQYEMLMKEIQKSDYSLSRQKELEIKRAQDTSRRILRGVKKRLGSSMAINGAERVLNRRNIGSFILTGIGTLGMVANYLANMQSAKGLGKLVAGFKSPYFMFSAAVTAGGVHMLQKGMAAGRHGESFFTKLLARKKRLSNPFGYSRNAEIRSAHFEDLVNIFKNHRLLERYFTDPTEKGFDDMTAFYTAKKMKQERQKADIRESQSSTKTGSLNLYEDYLKFVERTRGKNSRSAITLREAGRQYGKATMSRHLAKIATAQQALGIISTEYFNKTNIKQQRFTHKDLLLHRQGVKSIPKAKLPEERAKKTAEAKKKTKKADQTTNKPQKQT